MDFYAVLARVIELLQREGRTSYRALKRQFALDDEYLADLKVELIDVKQLAVDQDGTMLVWTGSRDVSARHPGDPPGADGDPPNRTAASGGRTPAAHRPVL
jgi:hypothetical protein